MFLRLSPIKICKAMAPIYMAWRGDTIFLFSFRVFIFCTNLSKVTFLCFFLAHFLSSWRLECLTTCTNVRYIDYHQTNSGASAVVRLDALV